MINNTIDVYGLVQSAAARGRDTALARVVASRLKVEGECWTWQGTCDDNGYGRLQTKGARNRKAHRLAFDLFFADVPADRCMLHRCDNPPCCNPAHLYVGTQKDNAADREARGRGNHATGARNGRTTHPDATARGERNSHATLTTADVLSIRRRTIEGERQHTLAAEYGIGQTAISAIAIGRTWKHVGGPLKPTTIRRRGFRAAEG